MLHLTTLATLHQSSISPTSRARYYEQPTRVECNRARCICPDAEHTCRRPMQSSIEHMRALSQMSFDSIVKVIETRKLRPASEQAAAKKVGGKPIYNKIHDGKLLRANA